MKKSSLYPRLDPDFEDEYSFDLEKKQKEIIDRILRARESITGQTLSQLKLPSKRYRVEHHDELKKRRETEKPDQLIESTNLKDINKSNLSNVNTKIPVQNIDKKPIAFQVELGVKRTHSEPEKTDQTSFEVLEKKPEFINKPVDKQEPFVIKPTGLFNIGIIPDNKSEGHLDRISDTSFQKPFPITAPVQDFDFGPKATAQMPNSLFPNLSAANPSSDKPSLFVGLSKTDTSFSAFPQASLVSPFNKMNESPAGLNQTSQGNIFTVPGNSFQGITTANTKGPEFSLFAQPAVNTFSNFKNTSAKPAETFSSSMKTADSFSGTLKPAGTSSNTFKPTEPISSNFKLTDASSGFFNSGETPSGLFKPVETSTSHFKSVDPQSTAFKSAGNPSSLLNPVETPSSLFKPVETQSSLKNPAETQSSLFKPVETQSNLKNPAETQSSLFKPVETTSSLFKPVETTSSLFKPVETTSSLFKPVETTSSLFKPTGTTSSLLKPVETTSSLLKPVETTSSLFKPAETTSNLFKSAESTPSLFKSVEFQSNHFKPIETQTSISKPAETTSSLTKPADSPAKPSLFNPQSTSNSLFNPLPPSFSQNAKQASLFSPSPLFNQGSEIKNINYIPSQNSFEALKTQSLSFPTVTEAKSTDQGNSYKKQKVVEESDNKESNSAYPSLESIETSKIPGFGTNQVTLRKEYITNPAVKSSLFDQILLANNSNPKEKPMTIHTKPVVDLAKPNLFSINLFPAPPNSTSIKSSTETSLFKNSSLFSENPQNSLFTNNSLFSNPGQNTLYFSAPPANPPPAPIKLPTKATNNPFFVQSNENIDHTAFIEEEGYVSGADSGPED